MGIYLDTSALVPLFFNETASEQTLARVGEGDRAWLSRWTIAEFSSAVAFKLRSRQTQAPIAHAALMLLRSKLESGDFLVAEIERGDFDEAARLCEAPASQLRTPDALHAAVAKRLRMPLITCDRTQANGCVYHAISHEYIGLS